eukprot:SM000080S22963  [mRNA]  locus=s80:432751:435390:+ [translate_table: standard]
MVDRRRVTAVLVALALAVDNADEVLLPSVYREVGDSRSISLHGLTVLTLARRLAQALACPIAAALTKRSHRGTVIAMSIAAWGATTAASGLSSSFAEVALFHPFTHFLHPLSLPPPLLRDGAAAQFQDLMAGWVVGLRRRHRWWRQLALARGLNGIALAWATPAIYSMVADTADAANRGLAFGWLRVAGNSGGIIGSGAAIMLAGSAPAAISRLACRLLAHCCRLLRALGGHIRFCGGSPLSCWPAEVPPSTLSHKETSGSGLGSSDHLQVAGGGWWQVLEEMLADTRTVMGVPTVQIIVAQGMVGSFPGAAFSFCTMWLELIGFTQAGTATLQILYHTATSVGALFGGLLGDIAARRLPNAGRIVCAQVSAGSAAIFSIVLLYGLPTDAPRPLLFAATLIPMGLIISWNGSATNNPIKAEIVPQKLRSNVYALDNALESLPASFAPYIVAMIAEHWYGYHRVGKGLKVQGAALANRSNARALSHGLLACMTMPWILCTATYGLLYYHYPKDRDRADYQRLANDKEHKHTELHPEMTGEVEKM